ncbi:hypothetical protein V8C34DRAFT_289221 [Trichoderma compactum]
MLAVLHSSSRRERSFPLGSRAWCFQENRMSQCVAHFAIDEVLWDCTQDDGVCQCDSENGILKMLNDWMDRADGSSWSTLVVLGGSDLLD